MLGHGDLLPSGNTYPICTWSLCCDAVVLCMSGRQSPCMLRKGPTRLAYSPVHSSVARAIIPPTLARLTRRPCTVCPSILNLKPEPHLMWDLNRGTRCRVRASPRPLCTLSMRNATMGMKIPASAVVTHDTRPLLGMPATPQGRGAAASFHI